jgi:hypothetical protein
MTAAPGYHQLIKPCTHCPSQDRCRTEGSCRATWDSRIRDVTAAAEREHAERVSCPDCGAQPGQPCRNLRTGEPLTRQPAHQARITTTEATP